MEVPAKAKARKKKAAAKKDTHAILQKLIITAIAQSKERKGVSMVAMKKALAAKHIDVVKANKRINTTLKKMVASGLLSQTKGTGASGSFKLAMKKTVMKKKRRAKAKKPAARAKKAASPKKKVVKKVPAKKPKSPAKKAAKKAVRKKSAAKKPAKRVVRKKNKVVKKKSRRKAPARRS